MRKGTKKKLKTAKEASLPFYTRGTPNNLQTIQKFKVPDFRDISDTLTAPQCHSFSIFFLLLFARKANIVCLLFIVSQTCFNKNDIFCFVNEFSLFIELLDNLATLITWPSEEDPTELWQPYFMDLSNTAWAWKDLTKQTEANLVVTNTIATTSTVTSSHTTLGSVTSIGPHLDCEFKPLLHNYVHFWTKSPYPTPCYRQNSTTTFFSNDGFCIE